MVVKRMEMNRARHFAKRVRRSTRGCHEDGFSWPTLATFSDAKKVGLRAICASSFGGRMAVTGDRQLMAVKNRSRTAASRPISLRSVRAVSAVRAPDVGVYKPLP